MFIDELRGQHMNLLRWAIDQLPKLDSHVVKGFDGWRTLVMCEAYRPTRIWHKEYSLLSILAWRNINQCAFVAAPNRVELRLDELRQAVLPDGPSAANRAASNVLPLKPRVYVAL